MANQNQTEPRRCISYEQLNLQADYRFLWRSLAIWMRSYMESVASGYDGKDAIERKLYQVPLNFYPKLASFIGDENAKQFTNLLSMHVAIGVRLFNAMKNGDQKAINENVVDWYKNADDIANFLTKLNPYWSDIQWKNLLYTYLKTGIDGMVALLSHDYDKGIQIYDQAELQTVLMADYMSRGLLFQLYGEQNQNTQNQ